MTWDLLTLFFSYKTFPNHYGPCRLWEVDKKEWKYYYGSNYHPHQRLRLRTSLKRREYSYVLADKYVCAMYCKAIGIAMPQTFGLISPEEEYKDRIRFWLESTQDNKLIIKPIYGMAGAGIVLAAKVGEEIQVRSATASRSLNQFVLADKSIVQEFIQQHAKMAAFSPASVNTVRIVTMLTRRGDAIVVNASLRAGVGSSFIDNFSTGGVSAGVNRDTGKLKKYAFDHNWHRYESHPISGVVFDGFLIPSWEAVRKMAISVQKAIPFYRMLGLDIAINESGEPVLIEINGAPDLLGLEQKAGPLLKNRDVLAAFGEYDLLINRHQKELYRSSQ